jgi:hypothetical protein
MLKWYERLMTRNRFNVSSLSAIYYRQTLDIQTSKFYTRICHKWNSLKVVKKNSKAIPVTGLGGL